MDSLQRFHWHHVACDLHHLGRQWPLGETDRGFQLGHACAYFTGGRPDWLVLLFYQAIQPAPLRERFVPYGPAAAYTGLALTTVGLGFALWARFTIGQNWGRLITVQEGHKVVRTGPYAIVRHPIYSGFMLATLGTAIAHGEVAGLIATALVVICWGYKSRLEERFMIEQFGAEYEQYRREVKGLIPGIW